MRDSTPLDAYNFFTELMGPTGLVASIVCGLAVIAGYSFPSQRKFPNIVLVWTCIVDFVCSAYIAMRWIDGPLKVILTDKILPGTTTCRISTFFDLGIEMGSGIVAIIVAYTLHATIVRNVDVDEFSEKYYWRFVIALWGISIFFPFLTLIDIHAPTQGVGFCTLTSTLGLMLILVPWVVMFLIEMRYIIPVIIYTIKIRQKISSHTKGASTTFSRGQIWLYMRFIGVLINQVLLWGSVIIWDVKNILQRPVPMEHIYIIGVAPIFTVFNGLIVLIGNKGLKDFILKQWDKVAKKWKATDPAKNGVELA